MSDPKEDLLQLMQRISRKEFWAGWVCDLEHILWSHVLGTARWREEDDYNHVPQEDVDKLLEMAFLCKGWWVYTDTGSFRSFVPMPEWLQMYNPEKANIA